ncbi:MAG: cyclic nucleotide-binding domain-containing protein [Magnetococcus sp. DMHC-6]
MHSIRLFLESREIFQNLPPSVLDQIATFTEILDFNDGEMAIPNGIEGKHQDLYLLVRGSTNISLNYEGLLTQMYCHFKPIENELYGEISWLLSCERTVQVFSKGPSRFVKINGEQFFNFLEQNVEVGFQIMRRIAIVLAKRVISLDEQIRDKTIINF